MNRLLLIVLLFCAVPALSQPKLSGKTKKAWTDIDTNTIRSHIAYLADDKLLGRLPGTPGYQMAVDYVVSQFTQIGVKPGGESSTFLQKFTLRKANIQPGSVRVILKDDLGNVDSLNRTDLAIAPNPLKASVSIIDAPIVFVGFGVELPGIHNDYANIDVRGKIVVFLNEAPKGMNSVYSAHFNNVGYKVSLAKQKGAIGAIIGSATSTRVYPPAGANPVAPFASPTLTTAINLDKTVSYGSRYTGQVDFLMNASNNFLRGLFRNSGKKYDDVVAALRSGKAQSFVMPGNFSASFSTTYQDVDTYNVIGMIPGTDATLKNEFVVHTAHLDHVGVGRPVDGDSIYNGAHDNASGVASLLEIARIYVKGDARPKRSVLIVMVSAEESGLVGSSYFASNPTVPKNMIVANVNTDMPTVIAPLLSIVPLGAAHSTMAKHVQFAANTMGISIEEDREPNENFFIRSDQYSFVREHIPAVNCKYGQKSDVPGFDLDKYIKAWRAKYYHKPQDQMEGGIFLFSAAKTYVQLNFLISYSVAMDKEKPRWNDGELF